MQNDFKTKNLHFLGVKFLPKTQLLRTFSVKLEAGQLIEIQLIKI